MSDNDKCPQCGEPLDHDCDCEYGHLCLACARHAADPERDVERALREFNSCGTPSKKGE